jgi:glucose/arabinose dehydrogenase
VIRIDPAGKNSANRQYGIPASNPFVKDPKALGEIYAMGFRNPHRITWTASGKMLVANIGQKMIEALYQVEAGKDYGWPEREGRFLLHPDIAIDKVFPLAANDSIDHYSYPVAEFDHDEGVAISGGLEYTGTTIPELKGKYFFGDIPSGRLFYVDVPTLDPRRDATIKEWSIQLDGKPTTFKEICGKDARIDLHFGRDAHGEMYVMTKYDGKLYKMVPRR